MNNDGNNATGRRLVCIVELFGSDANGRKMIAWGRKMITWGRRIGCRDAGHWFEPRRGVNTRLLVDTVDVQHNYFLM